jgi:hypothetical protein
MVDKYSVIVIVIMIVSIIAIGGGIASGALTGHYWAPSGSTGPEGPEGPVGEAGATILNGVSAPLVSQGKTGDFYYNTSSSDFFGPKDASWGPPVSLIGPVGPTGADGPQGITGPTGPRGATGATAPFKDGIVYQTSFEMGLTGPFETTACPTVDEYHFISTPILDPGFSIRRVDGTTVLLNQVMALTGSSSISILQALKTAVYNITVNIQLAADDTVDKYLEFIIRQSLTGTDDTTIPDSEIISRSTCKVGLNNPQTISRSIYVHLFVDDYITLHVRNREDTTSIILHAIDFKIVEA